MSSSLPSRSEAALPERQRRSLRTRIMLTGVSVFLLALFLYSAIVQHHDHGGVFVWMVYYYWSAFFSLVSITYIWGLYVSAPNEIKNCLYVLAGGLILWSLVLCTTATMSYIVASPSNQGGDATNLNDKEEKGMEVAGALVGLAGAIYHLLAIKYA